MSKFIDTSAFYALLDADDANHEQASRVWVADVDSGEVLITTNYVVVETCAVAHRRLGVPVLRRFMEDILPAVSVQWVDERVHDQGTSAVLMSTRRGPNIVDCVSFALIRALDVTQVFTFDQHFRDQGFECIP